MDIVFKFAHARPGELSSVLSRIGVGSGDGCWQVPPDRVTLIKQLTGGRSENEVFEILLTRGAQEVRKVLKVGPQYTVHEEYQRYRSLFRDACAFFAPIEAVTPGVLNGSSKSDEHEAVVYAHVAAHAGKPDFETATLEDLVQSAIEGNQPLDPVLRLIEEFFRGVQQDLYAACEVEENESDLLALNRHLGIDAVVEVDRYNPKEQTLALGVATDTDRRRARAYPDEIVREANSLVVADPRLNIRIGRLTYVTGLRAVWRGDRLIGQSDEMPLRIEIVAPGRQSLRDLPAVPAANEVFAVYGRLISLRARENSRGLLEGLRGELSLSGGQLLGPQAAVADPFGPLNSVLRHLRKGRVRSKSHGDLNPRNLLIVGEQPRLIDYAHATDSAPILADFVRLEGVLARQCLPANLTWRQHVRMQRLLPAVSLLGACSVHTLAACLAEERSDMARAFRVLAAVQLAARAAYPQECFKDFCADYLEQQFLFAHVSLKWAPDAARSGADLRAAAALAGVAAEFLSGNNSFQQWDNPALLSDGGTLASLLAAAEPRGALPMIAALARRLDGIQPPPPREAPVVEHLERARIRYASCGFAEEAHRILAERREERDLFIHLRAYIALKAQLMPTEPELLKKRRHPRGFRSLIRDRSLVDRAERLRPTSKDEQEVLEILAAHPRLVLTGDAGGGKSTVAREWECRLAEALLSQGNVEPRVPKLVTARAIVPRLERYDPEKPETSAAVLSIDPDELALGVFHITVDAINEVSARDRSQIADWLAALAKTFPRTHVLACHRLYNYVPGLLPFPVVSLEKVAPEQARHYIHEYLASCGIPDHHETAKRLCRMLLDDASQSALRDLAQTPLFLWMIVERFRRTGESPETRGQLFRDFARWYLTEHWHERTGEALPSPLEVEERQTLLNELGYKMVTKGETSISRAQCLPGRRGKLSDRASDILGALVRSGMLIEDEGQIRFLHQSFQEYFAARHFLERYAADADFLRETVRRIRWHDTLIILLGFAGEQPAVGRLLIEEALRTDPILTARCLRMAENVDRRLLEIFVEEQAVTLRTQDAGRYEWQRASRALAEHGRGIARRALLDIIQSGEAPSGARVPSLQSAAGMLSEVRFEALSERLRNELTQALRNVLEQPGPEELEVAVIETIGRAGLLGLSYYLGDRVQGGSWPVRRAAIEASRLLNIVLPQGQRESWLNACVGRLKTLEKEIYNETVVERMKRLNGERCMLLGEIADGNPALGLQLLLERRLHVGISSEVGRLVGITVQRVSETNLADESMRAALKLLQCRGTGSQSMKQKILKALTSVDDRLVAAASHVAEQYIALFASDDLRPLLTAQLRPAQIAALAAVLSAKGEANLATRLEEVARELMALVHGPEMLEAFSVLCLALHSLHHTTGGRIGILADWMFSELRRTKVHPERYPWAYVNGEFTGSQICGDMLVAGGDEAIAAVYHLSNLGGGILRNAGRDAPHFVVSGEVRAQFFWLAKTAHVPRVKYRFARAAVATRATELLPWLLRVAEDPRLVRETTVIRSTEYGLSKEPYLAHVVRAIGYLATEAMGRAAELNTLLRPIGIDIEQSDRELRRGRAAMKWLLQRYHRRARKKDPPEITRALATALGYVGIWEPLLTHLGAGHPWMHDAALNVFDFWVPKPPMGAAERERALEWINGRLRNNLSPSVRTTLGKLREKVAISLGHY